MKEYLKIKKNIWDNLLSERTGEQELQTDLSKFHKPITETQKATVREVTEGLRPIGEGIENPPQAITFPPTQPLGEATEKEDPIVEIAKTHLEMFNDDDSVLDKTFGLYEKGDKQ